MPSTTWPVEFNEPEAALLADLRGIDSDLAFTIEACTTLESLEYKRHEDLLAAESLSTAALVRYGRCFATGVRRRLPDEILEGLPKALQETHRLFIEVRHKHIAHSVNPFEENRVVVWVSDRPEETEVQSVSVQHSRLVSLGPPEASRLRELAEALRERVAITEETEEAKVLEIVRQLPYADFRNRDMPGAFNPSWNDVHRVRGQ